jgi:hypothetical protein
MWWQSEAKARRMQTETTVVVRSTRMGTRNKSTETTEAWWVLLTAILKSMRNRPVAWLVAIWLSGWALFAWHAIKEVAIPMIAV